jgi:endonuclease YncB( thermonuclease family)
MENKTYLDVIRQCPENVANSGNESCQKFSLCGLETAAKVWKVYDADTFRITIDLHGKPTWFTCRLLHVDGPEIRTKDPVEKKLAFEARDRLRALIADTVCYVKCFANDKYGRTLVEVTAPNGIVIHDWLLAQQLAIPYDGGSRKDTDWAKLVECKNLKQSIDI